jgi:YbbR domain-containing protein
MIPFLQNLILKDFWLKLFSFALASLLWIVVNIVIKKDISPSVSLSLTPGDQRVLHDLPIVILSSADGTHAFSVSPKAAVVTVKGDPASLRNLRAQDVRVLVDLTDSSAVHESHRRIEVSTPAGISHVKVEPEEVEIAMDGKN